MLEHLRWGFVLCGSLSMVLLAAWLSSVSPLERPRYGRRGAERQRVLEHEGLFAFFEPALRFLAALMAKLLLDTLRERQKRALARADDVLGLSPEELTALSLVSCVGLGASVWFIADTARFSPWYAALAAVFGLLLPTLQIREVTRRRAKLITRALPPAIEIAAMCMGAGLDFPGSLRMLAERNSPQPSPLGREFSVILDHLDLGHTRKEALEGFSDRVPSRAVTDFVHAVVQAEQKGNPLARVLQVQGRMLNMRRSVAAEEAAARAGVLMIVPMVLLVGAILLLLMGPFLVKGVGW